MASLEPGCSKSFPKSSMVGISILYKNEHSFFIVDDDGRQAVWVIADCGIRIHIVAGFASPWLQLAKGIERTANAES